MRNPKIKPFNPRRWVGGRILFSIMLGLAGLFLGLGWLSPTVGCGSALASDLQSGEKKKIETLIGGVQQMTDAVFIRNGKSYRPPLAAEFLRRKWKSHREEVRSAADFIDKVASFSSTTGKPYSIRWSDGRERLSVEFFRAQLSLLERPAGKQSS